IGEKMDRRDERRLAEVLRPDARSPRQAGASGPRSFDSARPLAPQRRPASIVSDGPPPSPIKKSVTILPVAEEKEEIKSAEPAAAEPATAEPTAPAQQPPQKKFPKANVDIEELRRAISESLKKQKEGE